MRSDTDYENCGGNIMTHIMKNVATSFFYSSDGFY